MAQSPRRPIRIAGVSGAATDRRQAMAQMAANHPRDPIDVMIGDWLSEANMTSRGVARSGNEGASYEPTFLEALQPALENIARYGIKVAVNAGASDTKLLHQVVTEIVAKQGLSLKVAYISGDEVFPAIQEAIRTGSSAFENICTGEQLADWKFEPLYAQAYLGGLGIAQALSDGADVVVCGRVSDASPVIGAAYWWHGWKRDQLHELANAFVAGHLIECSNYVCGGNFTGFKSLETRGWDSIGYPIAEIASNGQVVITKGRESGGEVSTQTCTSQLLYEIQGPWYYNSDVTAFLDGISFEQLGTNRVAMHGVSGELPPPTTKVGITARGGYQAEAHWFICGLDIEAKARMMEAQIRLLLKPHIHRFSRLEFTLNGTAKENASNQNAATVDLRVFAQAAEEADITPDKFLRPVLDPVMEGYPGATPHLDFRQGFPKPVYEYYVTLLPQSSVEHKVHRWDGTETTIDPPPATKTWPSQQPSHPSTISPKLDFGHITRGPLGSIVHARSGDKGSNANVGFWVRYKDEWDWLRSLLSIDKVKELLADEYKPGHKIDRFELPELKAVHFLLVDHLDRGVSCSSSYDFLGKNVAEFLRSSMSPQRSRNSLYLRPPPSKHFGLEAEEEEDVNDEDYEDDEEEDDEVEDDYEGKDDEEEGDDLPRIPGRGRPRVQKPIRQIKRKRSPSPEVASPKKRRAAPKILEHAIDIVDDDHATSQVPVANRSPPPPIPPSPGRTLMSYPPPRGTNLTLAADVPRYHAQAPHIRVALPDSTLVEPYRAPTAVMAAAEQPWRVSTPTRKEKRAQKMVAELQNYNVPGIAEKEYEPLPESKE
ncbi:hypothetical protein LTR95_012452 [Oleoguttula sp. CCFEE 5521]